MRKVILLVILIVLPFQVWASIENPQTVISMKAEIVQRSTIDLIGNVDTVELNFSIPQEDEYQQLEFFEVSDLNGICKTEKCSYSFFYDKYGNKMLKIVWEKPQQNIKFEIKSIVAVKARKSLKQIKNPDFLLPTSLVQSTDQEVADLASKAIGNDFEKVAFLSKWIYQNIRYDKIFSDITISAKDILRTKRGVCDEFSNLLVSFLRNLGYYSAVAVGYVYPGRIYEGEQFQPHGWTEVYTGNGIVADPTWTEAGYVDATHIKFGVFPDSNWIFGNMIARGDLSLKAILGKIETDIEILSFEEEPLISSSSSFLEKNVWKEYAVIKTDLSSDNCILTRINVKSCVDENGREILTKINEDDVVYFCGKTSYFSILEIPDNLKPQIRYNCTVNVLPYAGKQQFVPLTISFAIADGVKLFTEKSVLTHGEKMTVNAPNSHIFTDFGDYGFNKMDIISPYHDFKVYAYKSGYLMESYIQVVSEKPFMINISSPDNVTLGESIPVLVNVKNLRDGEQTIDVMFMGEIIKDNIGGSKNYYFNFTPQNVDDNLIQVFVSTLHYSASKSKMVEVIEKQGLLENIIRGFNKFFEWLYTVFKSIFK